MLAFIGPVASIGSRYTDFHVMPQCIRLPGARFKVIYHPTLNVTRTDDKKADVKKIMTDVNAMMENWIRERTGQWLWLHKRWPR